MNSSKPLFCSLPELLSWAPDDTPSIKCAYFVKDGRRCGRAMSQASSNRARLELWSHFELINGAFRGSTDALAQSMIVQALAEIYVCTMHYKDASKAERQWLEEFNAKGTPGNFQPEGRRRPDSSAKHTEDREGAADEIKEAARGSDLAAREPEKEEIPFEEEEGISALSSQSPESHGTIRRVLTMREDEVAKEVTWLLKQPLEGKAGLAGYIYILGLPKLPGKLKIGYTAEHPKEGRLKVHYACYGNYEIIATTYTQCAYRVEQLLLAEFSNKQYKLETGCQNCKHCHKELLEIAKNTLMKSLEKWIKFIALPAYDKSGLLRDEAQSRLPRPAKKQYLVCKRPLRRFNLSPSSTNKKDNKGIQIAPGLPLNFDAPASIAKSPKIDEAEVDLDDLCSEIEDLQLTPSKSRHKIK